MSEFLHLEGLEQRASPTRPLRGNLQVKSLPAPPASEMSGQRACRASALVPPDCWRPRPCASHGRPSLLRPPLPPRSRRQGHPLRVRRRGAAIVSFAAAAIVSIPVESSAVMAFVLFALALSFQVSFSVGVLPPLCVVSAPAPAHPSFCGREFAIDLIVRGAQGASRRLFLLVSCQLLPPCVLWVPSPSGRCMASWAGCPPRCIRGARFRTALDYNSAACARSSARGGPLCGPLSHGPLLYWAPLSHGPLSRRMRARGCARARMCARKDVRARMHARAHRYAVMCWALGRKAWWAV